MASQIPTRTSIHHAAPQKPKPKPSFGFALAGVVGELLITIAVLLGLYVVWQLWWTSATTEPARQQHVDNFIAAHPTAETPPNATIAHRTDSPPPVDTPPVGEVYGVLHVPKWDWMQVPIAEGIDQWILDSAFAGHYPQTQQPGELGNFAMAAHRRTYGNNFRRVDILEPGDPLIVETVDAYLVYTMDSFEIVDPSQGSVLLPVPNQNGAVATERMMTMTTCHPEYGSTHRYIVYSKLQYWTDKADGKPELLQDEPER